MPDLWSYRRCQPASYLDHLDFVVAQIYAPMLSENVYSSCLKGFLVCFLFAYIWVTGVRGRSTSFGMLCCAVTTCAMRLQVLSLSPASSAIAIGALPSQPLLYRRIRLIQKENPPTSGVSLLLASFCCAA